MTILYFVMVFFAGYAVASFVCRFVLLKVLRKHVEEIRLKSETLSKEKAEER